MKQKHNTTVAFFLCIVIGFTPIVAFGAISNDKITRAITFPVIGSVRYSNDFEAQRVGHLHQGNDVMGKKGQKLIAAVDGTIEWVLGPTKGETLGFSITDSDGYSYWYIHINNDTPGTDDGISRGVYAYAPDLVHGNPVVKEQLLGYMGDSGNAESTSPHLHFEIHKPNGDAINPFYSLNAAQRISRTVTEPKLANEMLPYGQFGGGASIAIGNVDMTNTGNEIVVGAGAGGGPEIRVLSQAGNVLTHFMAFDATQENRNGLDVATGDVNGDGIDEIIAGTGPGRSTEVRIFTSTGQLLYSFMPYGKGFTGGIRVASADLLSNGKAEIVTSPRKGGGPEIRVFNETGNLQTHFLAYSSGFRGGVDVAATAATATNPGIIVTSPGTGGGPHIRIFNRNGTSLSHFMAGPTTDGHGVRITVADIDSNNPGPEIITVPLTQGFPVAKVFSLAGTSLSSYAFFETWWEGGYDIAAAPQLVVAVSGTAGDAYRRTSIRTLLTTIQGYHNFQFNYVPSTISFVP